jgi:hypothetical protein
MTAGPASSAARASAKATSSRDCASKSNRLGDNLGGMSRKVLVRIANQHDLVVAEGARIR